MSRVSRVFGAMFLGILAVASLEARTVRVATFNIEYGPEGQQTPDYAATKAVLGRINADIVAFQEIFNNVRTNRIPDWRNMATELGYPYEVVAEENDVRAGHLYLGYYSRFPMQTRSVNSPAPASEMSRVPLRAVVQVPGAAKPLVLWNMHHKAGTTNSDQFRRAVEAYRIVQDIDAYRAANPTHDELVVLGDLNEDFSEAVLQVQSFTIADFQNFRTNLPSNYALGADLTALLQTSALPYRIFPDVRYSQAGGGLHRLDLFQQNGSTRSTRRTRTLDYIFVSTALRDSPLGAARGEVYNSALDASFVGLPKAAPALAAGTSAAASDHLVVFADIEMDDAVADLPTLVSADTSQQSLTGFQAVSGAPSGSQVLRVSAAGLGGPLQISAPGGFEVSLDGTNFFSGVAINAPPRADVASNYVAPWTNGSTGGNGFGPWQIFENPGAGQAQAFIGNPTNSGIEGMAPTAFALRASPANADSRISVLRQLARPLAVGEALSFDWGINWDSNNDKGGKGFIIGSGSASLLYVGQAEYPGHIRMWHNSTAVDTGIAYGTNAMRWTFRQVNAQTLSVTATARTNSATIAFSTNIPVPGAVSSFWWFAERMDPATERFSYHDNLNIAPITPGGGALSQANVLVRLANNALAGAVSGTLGISSAEQTLASVALSGMVAVGNPYDSWARSHGLDPLSNGARGSDADGDGHSNFQEFLFGSLPTQATGSLWRSEMQSSGLVLTFVGRETGVSYKLMSTGSLIAGAWSEEALEIAETQDQNGVPLGYKRRQVVVPNPSGNRFFRLQALESN
jgi:endonuclease/exonuclease/phosphatase family metal-dependent hydrolase